MKIFEFIERSVAPYTNVALLNLVLLVMYGSQATPKIGLFFLTNKIIMVIFVVFSLRSPKLVSITYLYAQHGPCRRVKSYSSEHLFIFYICNDRFEVSTIKTTFVCVLQFFAHNSNFNFHIKIV